MVSVWVATDQWEETSVQTMWSCLGCFWLTCWSQTLMIHKTRTQLCLAQQDDMIVNMIHCLQRCCALKCLVYIATCSLFIIRLYQNTSGWMQILWSKWFLLMKNVVWSMWGSIIIVQLYSPPDTLLSSTESRIIKRNVLIIHCHYFTTKCTRLFRVF